MFASQGTFVTYPVQPAVGEAMAGNAKVAVTKKATETAIIKTAMKKRLRAAKKASLQIKHEKMKRCGMMMARHLPQHSDFPILPDAANYLK